MRKVIVSAAILLLLVVSQVACEGGGTGTLEFYANGEDFVRQGFVSKDGWSIEFDHVYINLSDISGYQTDPPYDPESGGEIEGEVAAALDGTHMVDLAEGGENAPPILVGEVEDAPAGQYNAISWKMTRAGSGPAGGHSLVMIGTAEKDGQNVDFTIEIDEECQYDCGEYVGDKRKGILEEGGRAELEMTFHFDHIFGDAELPAHDPLNEGAVGFEPFAEGAEGSEVIDMAGMHLGHVGEGHCHCECG